MGFSLVRYQFALPVELLPEIAPYAEELGIRMGVEVHAPMWAGHPAVMAYREMYDKLHSPVLGWIPDFGGTASRIPASDARTQRALTGAKESLIDMLQQIWPEPGMSHEKAGKLREWRPAKAMRPSISRQRLAFFILANNDPKSWAELVDRTIHIHGKFYGVERRPVEEAIDYGTILPLFRDGGFTGTIVSRMGRPRLSSSGGFEQVERHQAMCRRIFAG